MSSSTGEMIAAGVIMALFVLPLWAGVAALGAFCFMWAWNLLMPLLWHAAPHLGFWHAYAACILIDTVKGIIQFSNTGNKTKT